MATDWTKFARACKINMKVATVTEVADFDAVIAFAVDGWKYLSDYFAQNVQVAADANKPCIAWVEFDPEVYGGINKGAYPDPEDDELFVAIDRALFNGGVYRENKAGMRSIDGIMIDMSDNVLDGGSVLTGTWVAEHITHVVTTAWNRYKLPIWLYFSKATFDYYKNDAIAKPSLEAVIDNYGICFHDGSVVRVNGYPASDESPWTNIPFSGKQGWNFWGIGYVNNLYTFVYNGYPSKLYDDIGFVPAETEPETPTDPEDPETPSTPGTVDNTAVLAQIAIANAKLDQLLNTKYVLKKE